MPKRERSGAVSRPARVVAPTSVKRSSFSCTLRALGPRSSRMSSRKSSIAGIEILLDGAVQPVDLVDEEQAAGRQRA